MDFGRLSGATVAEWRRPGKGKGSPLEPVLEVLKKISYAQPHASWHGAADPIAFGLPTTVHCLGPP